MFNLHTSLVASNEELAKFNSRNVELNKRNVELELIVVEVENLRQKIAYLENKVLCSSQIESALWEELAENTLTLKAYRNSTDLIQTYHEINQSNKTAIGFDYDELKKKKKKYCLKYQGKGCA